MNNYKDAIEFQNSNVLRVEKLLTQLPSEYSIKKFIYARLLRNENKVCFISNQYNFIKNFLPVCRFSDSVYIDMAKAPLNETHFFIWPKNMTSDPAGLALYNMDLRNGVSIVKKTENVIERLSFIVSSEQNELISICLNHRSVFLNFINYFQYHVKNSFNITDQIYYPFETVNNLINMPIRNPIEQELAFKNNINVKRYFFGDPLKNVYMTKQELKCFWYLTKNKTYKQIGHILNISLTTVRKHIDSVKLKTGINDIYEIIDLISKHGFFYCI